MAHRMIEVKPVERITVGAVGEAGHREFYLQARGGERRVTLKIEKQQVQLLSVSIERFLADLALRFPNLPEADLQYDEAEMGLEPPLAPDFQTGSVGMGYDEGKDLLLLVVRELLEGGLTSEDAAEAYLWCTRGQIRRMARWSVELARRGRPICGNCGNPIEPEGHFCPRRNGHKH
jgi:uncharacterized repeat protein (TIGR03847 family)